MEHPVNGFFLLWNVMIPEFILPACAQIFDRYRVRLEPNCLKTLYSLLRLKMYDDFGSDRKVVQCLLRCQNSKWLFGFCWYDYSASAGMPVHVCSTSYVEL